MSKKMLSVEELESQVALELPDREMMLVTVVITNLLNNNEILNDIEIEVKNNNVAVQICAVINALNDEIGTDLTCEINQNQ